ncbi:MAG TPA: DUF885 family protein [Anaerolineae bacterium]|nr:DUF885 family protein [Anaerolineae bacterium]
MTRRKFKEMMCGWLLLLLLAGCLNQPTSAPSTLPATATLAAIPTPVTAPTQPASPTAAPSPTPSATPEAPPITIELSPLAAPLQGLDIDAFFAESYQALLLRTPQYVTELGLSTDFGVGNDRLNDMSDAYTRETQGLETAILVLLKTYDRAALTPEQQLSYDIYLWYLEDTVRGHEFLYDDYIVRPGVIGYPGSLEHFLTQIHPVTSRQDTEDYITRLGQVQTQMEQVVDDLDRRAQASVRLPRFINQWMASNLREMSKTAPTDTPFYASFAEKLATVDVLGASDRQDLLKAAESAIQDSVLPGYAALADCLEAQQASATDEIGASKFPNGREYYTYILQHYTTTDLTADEIHELGLQEVARIRAEMQTRFDDLGYPAEASLPALYNRVIKESGILYGADIQPAYEALIEAAERDSAAAFDLRPQARVIVVGGESGGYYSGPAVDGSRPGAFYAATTGADYPYKMPSLAYHESVPGHHYQIALAQELDLPLFRTDIGFIGHIEGWALYAERLAYDLGWYEGNVYGDLGRLQYEMFRAVRLVVDTGVHAKGWTYDEAATYMVDNIGYPRGAAEGELWRYITWPGQATAYKIGMIKLLELRQKAQDALGDQFDLKAFHNVVIGNGGVPLTILERLVNDTIATAGQ